MLSAFIRPNIVFIEASIGPKSSIDMTQWSTVQNLIAACYPSTIKHLRQEEKMKDRIKEGMNDKSTLVFSIRSNTIIIKASIGSDSNQQLAILAQANI